MRAAAALSGRAHPRVSRGERIAGRERIYEGLRRAGLPEE